MIVWSGVARHGLQQKEKLSCTHGTKYVLANAIRHFLEINGHQSFVICIYEYS